MGGAAHIDRAAGRTRRTFGAFGWWRVALVMITSLFTLPILAAELEPGERLQRMGEAMESTPYEGVFVYSHGDRSDTLRVIHGVVDDESRERVTALTGDALEIIRHGARIVCLLPDQDRAVIGHQPRGMLPGALADGLDGALDHYRLVNGDDTRVAGRDVSEIRLEPVDRYRHEVRLWVDRETDLLLRSDRIDGDGAVLERMMFTALEAGQSVAAERFDYSLDDVSRVDEVMAVADGTDGAAEDDLHITPATPPGFRLIAVDAAGGDAGRQHAVYSDGVTTVSLFIDETAGSGLPASGGTSALTMRSATVNGYRLTALGAVPAATLEYMLAGAGSGATD